MANIKNKKLGTLVCAALSAASTAWAQEQAATVEGVQAEQSDQSVISVEPDFALDRGSPFYFGSVRVYPKLGVRFGSDDNVRAVPDTETKTSNNYWLYTPSVFADYVAHGQRYELNLNGSFRRNDENAVNDVDSQSVQLSGDNMFTSRHRLGWQLSHKVEQEDFEADLSRDIGEVVKSRTNAAAFTYRYGADGAPGRIEADLGRSEKRYLTQTDRTSASDSDSDSMGLRVLLRLMPKTFGFVEVQDLKTDSRDNADNRDSDQRSYNLGLTWMATAKTTGAIRLGHTKRDYEKPGVRDYSGPTWQLSVNWAPLTYSRLSLISARTVGDSTVGTFGATENDTFTLSWSHAWKTYLRSTLSWSRQEVSYKEDSRRDKTTRYLAGLYYSFPRNYSLGFELTPSKRDSTDSKYQFDRKQYMAVFQATF